MDIQTDEQTADRHHAKDLLFGLVAMRIYQKKKSLQAKQLQVKKTDKFRTASNLLKYFCDTIIFLIKIPKTTKVDIRI